MNRRLPIFFAAVGLSLLGFSLQTSSPKNGDKLEAGRLNNLGVAYMNQQFFDKALKNFEQAAKLDPELNIAQVNQGVAFLNLGKVEEAKPLLEEAVKRDPTDPHAWFSLGLLRKNANDPPGAVEAFQHVIDLDANDADTWYFLGTVYSQLRQFPQAIDAFDHALKLNPLHASAQFGLSRAYQQSGNTSRAREHLLRFQYITKNKLGAAISLAYGEQGKYSLAEESAAVSQKVPDAIPLKFVDVTREAGLITKSSGIAGNNAVSSAGPGACLLDYDGDGKVDIFLPDNGEEGGVALYHNLGNGKFEDVTRKAGLDPALHGIGCTAGDYDNDGAVDIAVSLAGHVMLLHNEKNGTFKDVTEVAGIHSDASNLGLTFIDYDHDGDLDLYVTRTGADQKQVSGKTSAARNLMWRNNGNGTFTNVTESVGLAGMPASQGAIGTDYNNDRAIDLLVTSRKKTPVIFENPREGAFVLREKWNNVLTVPAEGVAILDFNHDGWMDIAFTHQEAPAITLWRNDHGKGFQRVTLPATDLVRAYGVAVLDYDDDGWVDLVAVGETKDGRGLIKLFRNLGPDGFKDVSSEVGLDKIQLQGPRAVVTADFDNDGATGLLITQSHGAAVLLKNIGGNKNNWLRLGLTGLNDNKSAIGTKVEVFAGGNRQKFELAGSSGYLGQNSPQIVVGLGQAKQADVVRILWPAGVLQDEIEVAGNRQQNFNEIDRRGSSCPTLFVWNGEHYELVADILGAGVIGHWVGPGQRNIPRPTEWVKIDRDSIRELRPADAGRDTRSDGALSFRLMEPMEEVVYLDQVKLLAVDHPSAVEVYPNEYFASNPPYPAFKVIASRRPRPPAGAWDEHGHDVLPSILTHKYFGDFELLPFKGFAKPHSLLLDLGETFNGGPVRLLMHGEIEYFTATGMYAADQAGIQAIAPYVEAQDAKGNWHRILDDMGFPAGLPRTITADLSSVLPRRTKRIRITTNLQIYWDNILIDRTPQSLGSRLSQVPLQKADLEFHGYPRQIEAQPPGNVKYVYGEVSRTGPYARQAGAYTRYGNVRSLLAESDDRLVVMGSGEEVALEFDPHSLPSLPRGWTRDYFFEANGYEKDMDFYAADGSTVEPLPFKSMGKYPYDGKSFPADARHVDYLLNYNTRYVSGNEPAGYSYNYGSTK